MKNIAIISSHPIQYNAPFFKSIALSGFFHVKVFYTFGEIKNSLFDKGFQQNISWDIDLLEGYNFEFLENKAKKPSLHRFFGIKNPGIKNKLKDFHPDFILIYGWNYRSHLSVMVYFKNKVPVLFRGDSTLLDESNFLLKKIIRRICLLFIFKFIDYALYTGTNNKKYFLKHGIKEKRLLFIPHAIDNNRFVYINHEQEELLHSKKQELEIRKNNLVFIFAGKFEPKKDPLILIKAAKKIENKNIHFIFVGSGILENEMKNKAEGLKNIHFFPFQNQSLMPIIYRLGDVLVLPSKGPDETWGLAVNEAMASGLAVIASNKVGCSVDLVKNGENGFIFNSSDIIDLIQKISLINPININQFKKRSIEIISFWSYEAGIKELIKIQ